MAKREGDAGGSGRADARADAPSRSGESEALRAPDRTVAPEAPVATPSAAEAPADGASTAPGHPAPPRKKRTGRLVLLVLLLAAAGYGGKLGTEWWTHGRFVVSTDDAYVTADITTLAAKVSGYVAEVTVADNQTVRAGDVIARIDDGDYRLALRAAENKIASQDATIAGLDRQIEASRAGVEQAKAEVAADRADLAAAEAAFERTSTLTKTNVMAQASLDDARAARDKAAAALNAGRAAVTVAEAQVSVLEAEKVQAERARVELETARDQAARDLSYTVVRAPVDGVIGNKAVEVGAYVQPGQRLAALVPLASVHVEANFKETQLGRLKVGQAAEITVDAFGGERVIEGEVESVAPATGSVFSLLPPENATGNFTKIVQRVPVRIALPADATADGALRAGLSVIAGVDTRGGE